MGDVIDLKPKQWTDGLLGLPESPMKACSKCGRGIHDEPHTWMSRDYGCGVCAPEMEGPTMEISGLASRVFMLEEALRIVVRSARIGLVGPRQIQRVLDDLQLVLPPGDAE